jgi:hypothetical protein
VYHVLEYEYDGDHGTPPYYSWHIWELDEEWTPPGGVDIPGLYGKTWRRPTWGTEDDWTEVSGQVNPTWIP